MTSYAGGGMAPIRLSGEDPTHHAGSRHFHACILWSWLTDRKRKATWSKSHHTPTFPHLKTLPAPSTCKIYPEGSKFRAHMYLWVPRSEIPTSLWRARIWGESSAGDARQAACSLHQSAGIDVLVRFTFMSGSEHVPCFLHSSSVCIRYMTCLYDSARIEIISLFINKS